MNREELTAPLLKVLAETCQHPTDLIERNPETLIAAVVQVTESAGY
jgi:hypothetical protein